MIGIYHIPDPCWLGRAGGPEAPAPPASLSLGLDRIVTSRMQRLDWLQARLRSIMADSRPVRWEVCGAMPGLPGLTTHAYIPIDSNTGHVRVETEADKEYWKTERCRHHTGRQPASHANELPL